MTAGVPDRRDSHARRRPPGVDDLPRRHRAARTSRIVTAGGRVLTVVGAGADYPEAIDRAYAGVSAIEFDGMQYRRDIGRKGDSRQ